MFHRLQPPTDLNTSRKETNPPADHRTFKWIITVLFIALLAIGASSATLAARASSPTVNHNPLLKVVPKNIGIPGDGINCTGPHSGKFAWICHVTLTELKSSASPLHWFTRSDQPARFTPASGNLSPGQSVQVTIATNFCGGFTNFYFVGPKNVATVQYQCG